MTNKQILPRLLILAAAVLFTVAAGKMESDDSAKGVDEKKKADTVVAVVGGEKITEGDLDEMLALMSPPERRQFDGMEGRQMLLDILIKNKILLKESNRVKLDKDPAVARDIEDARMRILASAYFNRYIAAKMGIPDEEVSRYYDAHKEEFKVPARVTLRHILVATPEDGDAVLKRLQAGDDFAAVATELSKDEYTAANGGLIGEVTEEYVPFQVGNCEGFKEAVFTLGVKTPSALVKSDRGYHIFYVDAKTDATYAPLEQADGRIRERILVPEDDCREFFNVHREEYTVEAGALLRQILVKDEATARALLARARKGEDFEALVKLNSVDDSTKNNGGLLGWTRPGGYIQGIGQNADIDKAVFAAKEGDIVGPFKTDAGFHLLKVERRREFRQMEYDEVKDRIFSQLADERRRSFYEQAFRNLETQYKVQRYGWARQYEDMGPAELMTVAESAATPLLSIQAYDKYVERFPNDPQADKALFMSGFLYSEELRDYASAKDKFRQLLAKYPKSDYAESARWMIENMGKEDAGAPPPLPDSKTPKEKTPAEGANPTPEEP